MSPWRAAARVGLGLGLAVGLAGAVALAEPADREATAAELEQLRAQIAAVRERIAAAEGRYGSTERELRAIEGRIGEVGVVLRRTEARLESHRHRLQELEGSEQALADQLERRRLELARQVRASYAMGRQEKLKVLLNQGDPATIGRALAYYDYLNRARSAHIRRAARDLQRLQGVRAEIVAERAALEELRARQVAQRQTLEDSRNAREAALAALGAQLQSDDSRLRRLMEGEQELEQVLRALEEALADLPTDGGLPFAESQGQLPWPVAGRLVHGYGSARAGGQLRWRGVLIGAERGSEVRAVSRGRVAFADWMRGYGMLLIVDHGDGFMTLYGHNQSLYKEVGEWVQAGEAIASVGDSGGQSASGLYFEIRRDGKPVDPTAWCRAGDGAVLGLRR